MPCEVTAAHQDKETRVGDFLSVRIKKKSQKSHTRDCEQCIPPWCDDLNSNMLDLDKNDSFTMAVTVVAVSEHMWGAWLLRSNSCAGSI